MTQKILVIIVVFLLGFTLGQGHKPFDINGDGRLDKADITALADKLKQ